MINKKEYSFENIYVISTYKCNCDCDFCLCKRQESQINNKKIIEQLKYLFKNKKDKKYYIKITGGEPFLNQELIKEIIKISSDDIVYKIGIGTNGTIEIPDFINNTKVFMSIFLSRHHFDKNKIINSLNTKNKNIDIFEIVKNINNEKIRIHTNCNLIKNKIDSIEKIENYLEWAIKNKIFSVTFRELNKIPVDIQKYNYDNYINDYLNYYKHNIIKINNIFKKLIKSNNFEFLYSNGNYYDTNYRFNYKYKIFLKLRLVDEIKLFEYNLKNNFDEWNILPDGTLLKSWLDNNK